MQYDDEAIPISTLRNTGAERRAEGWKRYLDDDDTVFLFCTDGAEGRSAQTQQARTGRD
jgi:hypothetical protein